MVNTRSTKSIAKTVLLVIAVLAAIGAAVYYFWPLLAPFGDEVYLRRTIDEAGAWGPAVFMLIHAIQIVIAPIPGQVIGFVGGYLYGPLWGTIYAVIGSAIGIATVLVLSRKLGRPFVERFVPDNVLKRFDYLTKRAGSITFFLIFLLPGFPDDIIGFVAGLTKIRLRTLMLVSVAGRLPGYAVLSVIGHGFTRDNLNPVVGGLIAVVMFMVVTYWKRAWIREFVRRRHRVSWAKREWLKSWRSILIWTAGLGLIGVVAYELITWLI